MSEGTTSVELFVDKTGNNAYEKVICMKVKADGNGNPIDVSGNVINEAGGRDKHDQYVKATGADVAAGSFAWRYIVEHNEPVTIPNMAGLGVGQTWQDMSAQRVLGTQDTNNTGKPIMIAVHYNVGGTASYAHLYGYVDNVLIATEGSGGGAYAQNALLTLIIPNGSRYKVTKLTGTGGKQTLTWWELR